MNRIIRFIKLTRQYLPHLWEASKYKHAFYIIHKTDSAKEHDVAKKIISKAVGHQIKK